jgi:nucleoside-diphosphate-sugar epimerase
VLITGGLGFLGYHLATDLLRRDGEVSLTIVDNLSSTKMDYRSLIGRARIEVLDLRLYREGDGRFDDIYHLASPVGSLGILARTGHIIEDILSLTYRVVRLALRSEAKLLFVSSSEVYGQDGIHEEGSQLKVNQKGGARAEYALGKMASEVILRNLSFNHPLRYNVCRPFNVIGEQQSAAIGFVVPTFFESAFRGDPIPVFAPGTQRRSFCHVSDVVRAMVAIQESPLEGETFNAGHDGNVISIQELAALIRTLCRSRSRIEVVDSLAKFGRHYSEAYEKIPDLHHIRARLPWQPELGLQESLARIHADYWRRFAGTGRDLAIALTGQGAKRSGGLSPQGYPLTDERPGPPKSALLGRLMPSA